MKKLDTYKQPTDLTEAEYYYPEEIDGTYTEGYYGEPVEDDEKRLIRALFSTLRKHWFLIVGLNLIVTALTIIYVAQEPDYYTAAARIQVNSEINPAAGIGSAKNPIIVNNSGADPAYFATQLQILEGSGLMRRVIKTIDLENNEDFLDPQKNNRLSTWQNVKRMFGFYTPTYEEKDEIAAQKTANTLSLSKPDPVSLDKEVERLAPYVGRLKRGLDVSPVFDSRTKMSETRLIDIIYTHQNPVVATKIANAIGDAYVLQNLEQKVQSNASAGDFLQKRIAELQAEIRRGEEQLINYARYNKVIPPDSSQNTIVRRLGELNSELGRAENDRIAAQTAYQAAMQNQMWNTTVESGNSQVLSLESQLNGLRQKLAQLRLEYKDDWYEIVQVKEQIATVEDQLKSLRKRATDIQVAALKERFVEAVEREKLLKESFERQRAEVIKQNEASINYRIIEQEINTNKSLLNGLLQRSRENEVILTGTPNNVLVLDRALVPRAPAGPDRTRSVFMAFFVSLGMGIGLAFMIEWFNDTINHTEDVENKLGLPLLASIPLAPQGFVQRLSNKFSLRRRNKAPKRIYDLEAFEKPEFLESYMQLGAYLMLSKAGGPPKTILITSAEEGEGKSVTALNLAYSLAKTKGKVLIIDADLRCPRIHKIKKLDNKIGLTTLLAMNEIDEDLLDQSIQKDPSCNLYIMTAGQHTVNPGNLLSSAEMERLLQILSSNYTHILIDSPPVLYHADSAIISTLVESVIMVVRDGVSSKQIVLKAKNILQKVGARIVGVVLNGVPIRRPHYYYYSDYYSNDLLEASSNGENILKIK